MNRMQWVVVVAFLAGCNGNDDVDTDDTDREDSEVEALSHATDIQPIWNAGCVGCHIGAAQGGLALEDGHTAMVGVASSIGMNYVTSGSPDDSYLWHKLNDTHLTVGGTGDAMPQTGAIRADQLADIEAWILSGAAP